MRLQVFKSRCALAICTWAHSFAVFQSDALALRNLMEIVVANITAIDVKAASVLPSMSDLKVANPRLVVEGALFFVRVQLVDITPTSPLVMFSLNAFV